MKFHLEASRILFVHVSGSNQRTRVDQTQEQPLGRFSQLLQRETRYRTRNTVRVMQVEYAFRHRRRRFTYKVSVLESEELAQSFPYPSLCLWTQIEKITPSLNALMYSLVHHWSTNRDNSRRAQNKRGTTVSRLKTALKKPPSQELINDT